MEDYWRMCMGMSNRQNLYDLNADDFSDVFGGPPRSVLCRKYSGDFTQWTSFYDEAFRPLEFNSSSSTKGGRSLPSFNIPARGEGLDNDVFRSADGLRHFPADVFRWNSTTMVSDEEPIPPFPSTISFNNENLHVQKEDEIENLMKKSPYYGSCKRASSPEINSSEPSSHSSPASCFHQEPETETGVQSNPIQEYEDEDDDDDEVMSSYVIELNSDFRQSTSEAVSIDDAIAWAKERCNTQKSDQRDKKPSLEEPQIKDEDVKHWSSGNENNIRMLLSTLHNILWPNSGWNTTDITSLAESSQVRKAYQKARLCLHPDKLQQRGATISQKYIAEKAFSILQDAWDAFISQDVFFNQMTMQGILESFWGAWNKQGVHGFEGLRTVLKT